MNYKEIAKKALLVIVGLAVSAQAAKMLRQNGVPLA